MQQAFIIHGWGGNPQEAWFPWLKTELEKIHVKTEIPAMPMPEKPQIEMWVQKVADAVKNPDPNTYLIGHSIGCQTILRYLERNESDQKIGGAVLVAPWINLLPAAYTDEEDKQIAQPWLDTPIKWNIINNQANYFTVIFSDNDPYVPLTNKDIFQKNLDVNVVIENNKGHLGGDDNIASLPSALSQLQKWL